MRSLLAGCVVLSVSATLAPAGSLLAESAAVPSTSPWDLKKLYQPPTFRWLDQTSRVRSLVYQAEAYQGHATEVFAFYATPGSISGDESKDSHLPGVVLIHGGGGTAFAEWVWLWAKRGYAAVAMDLSGHRPPAPQFDPQSGELIIDPTLARDTREPLELAGPDQGGVEKFESIGGAVDDDWSYHAVADVIRAHSLLASFEAVDAHRTAVTGISWGGYLTCLVASLDDRFKAAVPVYGCGFLYEGSSVQKRMIDGLGGERRALWSKLYDPSQYMAACRTPILFVNGTNDKHYPLDSYAKTYGLVQGPRQLRLEPGMRHGHRPGWEPKEIGLFIDHYLLGTDPLPTLGHPKNQDGRIAVECHATVPLVTAAVHYTTDTGPLVSRPWQSLAATVGTDGISADGLPSDAAIWLMTVTDQRGAMVSTEAMFVSPISGSQ